MCVSRRIYRYPVREETDRALVRRYCCSFFFGVGRFLSKTFVSSPSPPLFRRTGSEECVRVCMCGATFRGVFNNYFRDFSCLFGCVPSRLLVSLPQKKNPFVCSVATFPECSLTQTSLTFGGVRDLVCVCVCVCCPWKDSIHIFCRYLSSPKKGALPVQPLSRAGAVYLSKIPF